MNRAIILIFLLCVSFSAYAYTPNEDSSVRYESKKEKDVSSKEDIEKELEKTKVHIEVFKIQIQQEKDNVLRELRSF